MNDFFTLAQISLILFELVILLITLSNLYFLRRLGTYPTPAHWPRVSVLVPARNEEANIGPCVQSLLAQHYPDFQVLVLDDHSSDGTWQILARLASENNRLQIIQGKELPGDWLGKHWACHQLAQVADGDLLLFTDADTRHQPLTLRDSVAALLAEEADLLTALPHEEVISWGERLVVPIIPWSIFAFVPLGLAYRLRLPLLSATVGQFMLFRRQAYERIGGYEAVRQDVVDDLALGRRLKAQGLRWRLVDGGRHVCCRMYQNFQQVYEGVSKNLFAAFGYRVLPFVFVWLWLTIVFWGPLLVLALKVMGGSISLPAVSLAFIAIFIALLLWGVTFWRFGFPRYLLFLYPIIILLTAFIAMRSMVLSLAGWTTWKGRTLARQRVAVK